jgi:Fic family protein
MNKYQQKINELKIKLESLRPIKPEFLINIKDKFELMYNHYTNTIEGSTLTIGETESLIRYNLETKINKSVRDVEEMRSHIKQYNVVGFLSDKILTEDGFPLKLNQNYILDLHKVLYIDDKVIIKDNDYGQKVDILLPAGRYKPQNNHVHTLSGKLFKYADFTEVQRLMTDLLDWYETNRKVLNPVELASIFHYKFIRIHPFSDANGRMSRFLLNLILQSSGLGLVVVTEKDRNEYLESLENTDRNFTNITVDEIVNSNELNLYKPFIDYIYQNEIRSLELMIKGANGEDIFTAKEQLQLSVDKIKKNKNYLFNNKEYKEKYFDAIFKIVQHFIEISITYKDFLPYDSLRYAHFSGLNIEIYEKNEKEFIFTRFDKDAINDIKANIYNLKNGCFFTLYLFRKNLQNTDTVGLKISFDSFVTLNIEEVDVSFFKDQGVTVRTIYSSKLNYSEIPNDDQIEQISKEIQNSIKKYIESL